MQPEMKELCTPLNKLRKLRVRGIFIEFDLLWTAAFLAAAPSVEMLHIEVMQLYLFFPSNLCCLLFSSPHLGIYFLLNAF
jgi:hypothetical protein